MVISNITKEHIKHLEQVFQKLIGYKLHVNTKKIQIPTIRDGMLGHPMIQFEAKIK